MGDDSELQNKMELLTTAIETLTTSLDAMSTKYVTPTSISDVITGYAVKFGMAILGNSDTWTGGASDGPLCYDQTEYFYSNDSNITIYRIKPGDVRTTIATSSLSDIDAIAYDTDNEWIVVGQGGSSVSSGTNAIIEVYDTSGILLYSNTISNPVLPPTELNIIGLAYDRDNSKMYVLYYGPTYDVTKYGEIDVTTGVISNYIDINDLYQSVQDVEVYNGVLYILMPDMMYGFRFGESVPTFVADIPNTAPNDYLCIDDSTKVWYFANGTHSYLQYCGLSHIQRISIFDDGGVSVTIDATSLPLPTGAATAARQDTMITALQLIDNLTNALKSVNTDQLVVEQENAPSASSSSTNVGDTATELVSSRVSRRGLLIVNTDTEDTVWIGATGVTTGTGLPILPYQSLPLNNFTGATANLYGICAAGKSADVRVLEVF